MNQKTNLKKIIFVGIMIFIFALFAELLSIIVIKIKPGLAPSPAYGLETFTPGHFYLKPHHYYALEGNPEYKSSTNKVNRYGLEGDDFPRAKPPGEYRIACLGGSTTHRMDAGYLRDSLKILHPGGSIRIINGGMATYTTAETLIAYMFKISYLEPDLIMVYHAINDVFPEACYRESKPDYSQYRKMWKHTIRLPGVFYRAMRYSCFLKLMHYFFVQRYFDVWSYSLHPLKMPPVDVMKNINSPSFGQYFKKNMSRLINTAQGEGVKVMLVTFVFGKTATEPRQAGINKLNTITRTLASENGCYLMDLEQILKNKGDSTSMFADEVHFSLEGERWKTERIAEFIKDNRLIE